MHVRRSNRDTAQDGRDSDASANDGGLPRCAARGENCTRARVALATELNHTFVDHSDAIRADVPAFI